MTGVDLDEVRRRYTAEEPPPCRVCGGELSIQSMGGGEPTQWACADRPRDGSDEWSDHYRRSEWVQYKHGDPDVLALVDEVATARWRAEDPEARALILPDLGDLLQRLMGEADRYVPARTGLTNRGLPLWRHSCGNVEDFDAGRLAAIGGGCDACESGSPDASEWQPLYVRGPGGAR